jgi:uncharacterized membrane protein YuzA (DUF378 family)
MEKYLCYGALGVAGVMAVLFLVDIVAQMPFGGGPFVVADVLGLISSGMVGYLGFNASKDLK